MSRRWRGRCLRKWADKELAPQVAAMEKGEILPYDLMRKLVAAFGMGEMVRAQFKKMEDAPRRASGGGEAATPGARRASAIPGLMAIVSMELSRVCPGFCLAFGASLGLAGGAIMAKGTLAQKRRWALPILTMEKIGAWGMTEPGAGSDAFGSMRTTARRDGDHFVLNGQKTFITNAPYADTFVIYAKIDRATARRAPIGRSTRSSSSAATPGLSTGKPMDKMGMHSSPTGEVFLADVRVPADQLLGGQPRSIAREEARDVFHGERTGMAPMCLGIIERCLEDSLAYAKQRETWGKQIAEYQLVQEKLARMYVHRENVRNLLFRQLEKLHKKVPISDGRGLGVQALLRARHHRGDARGHPDHGRQRLHARVPRRDAHARRQAPADRRRHRRDPDHHRRAPPHQGRRPELTEKRARRW